MNGQPLHADVVALRLSGAWQAVMITGPSGSGKSDLALRLMGRGWRLVADDYACIWASGGCAWATAPSRISGLIEVRGLGITSAAALRLARVRLVVTAEAAPERLPEWGRTRLAGVEIPTLGLDLKDASTVEKVAVAIARL